jgi:hypothetical protein
MRSEFGPGNDREQDGRENGDDGDNHEQFNERECSNLMFPVKFHRICFTTGATAGNAPAVLEKPGRPAFLRGAR